MFNEIVVIWLLPQAYKNTEYPRNFFIFFIFMKEEMLILNKASCNLCNNKATALEFQCHPDRIFRIWYSVVILHYLYTTPLWNSKVHQVTKLWCFTAAQTREWFKMCNNFLLTISCLHLKYVEDRSSFLNYSFFYSICS